MKKITVLIPAYNEEEVLPSFKEALDQVIEGIDFQPFDEHFLLQESTQYRLNGMFNYQEKRILQSDRYRFSSYFKRENILIHFNEVTELEESLELKYENTGSYSFERISLVSRPYDPVEAARLADEKQNQALIIQTFESDYVVGTIQNEEEGVLVTSIPYSEGWTVLADGEELPTEKVNIGFVGARIPAGEYEIEFVYETPYLKLGFAITIVGLVGVGLLYLNKIRE